MNAATRALVFSYSDAYFYFAGTTIEPIGNYASVEYLKDESGKLIKFPNLFLAKQALFNLGFEKGWLVMYSAYDEMIGNGPAQQAELPWFYSKPVGIDK
ncbi:MAG: hypothetical protein EOO68_15290 [Moraxellaceae bacterium]|jgi:hypothetical protein|nr:MAG: hypothetical protein EOO68_15290 [Moraxellaceae bacterium]